MSTLLGIVGNYHQYLVIIATIIASASVICKGAENVIAALSVLFPNAAKANGFLNMCITSLAKIQSNRLLQGLALNPMPGAPSHPVASIAYTSAPTVTPVPK
jgi:hypothetical protein